MSLRDHDIATLLERTAARDPTPGGGSVVPVTAAIAAALGAMVGRYSQGRTELAAHAETHTRLIDALDRAREVLLRLADEDAAAYALLGSLQRLDADDEGRAELPAAALAAASVPLSVIGVCGEIARSLAELSPIANRWLRSDLEIAAILASACAEASACSVRANVPILRREGLEAGVAEAADLLVAAAQEHARRARGDG